jgi:hypothetical protein
MLTLSRRQCRQFVALARRAFSVSTSRLGVVTGCARAGRDGPVLWAARDGVTLACGEVVAETAPELVFPLSLLAEADQRASEITLEPAGKQVACRYSVSGVPQLRKYVIPKDGTPVPELPRLSDPGEGFLDALRACAETTDREATRYALGCVRLRGKEGDLAATDSRQALIRRGFSFPFQDELLLPRPELLRSRELDGPVSVGLAGKSFVLRAANWTLWLPPGEGRFPKVEAVVPNPDEALASVEFDPADRDFLLERIEALPGASDAYFPVTVETSGGACLLRAGGTDADAPVEVLLPRSRATGQDVRIAMNRTYLSRALTFSGRLRLYGPDRVFSAADGPATYLAMALEAGSVVAPSAEAVRVGPDGQARPAVQVPKVKKETMNQDMKQTTTSPVTPTAAVPSEEGGADLAGLIRRADAAAATLSAALQDVRRLSSALRRRRKAERLVKTTLDGLRKLKTLDAAA